MKPIVFGLAVAVLLQVAACAKREIIIERGRDRIGGDREIIVDGLRRHRHHNGGGGGEIVIEGLRRNHHRHGDREIIVEERGNRFDDDDDREVIVERRRDDYNDDDDNSSGDREIIIENEGRRRGDRREEIFIDGSDELLGRRRGDRREEIIIEGLRGHRHHHHHHHRRHHHNGREIIIETNRNRGENGEIVVDIPNRRGGDRSGELIVDVPRRRHHHHRSDCGCDREVIVEDRLPCARGRKVVVEERRPEKACSREADVFVHKLEPIEVHGKPQHVVVNAGRPMVVKTPPVVIHRHGRVRHEERVVHHRPEPLYLTEEITKVVRPVHKKVFVEQYVKKEFPCADEVVHKRLLKAGRPCGCADRERFVERMDLDRDSIERVVEVDRSGSNSDETVEVAVESKRDEVKVAANK